MYHIRYEDENYAVWLEPDDTQVSLWEEKEPLFVCGKLMEPTFLSTVIGREPAMAPAVAVNCSRAWQDHEGKSIRFLTKSEEGFVPGMALLGITDQERKKIEAFEGIESIRKVEGVILRIGGREINGISFFMR